MICSYTDSQTVQASQTCDVCQWCLHLCQQGAPSEALHRFCAAHQRHWSDPGRRPAGDQTSVDKRECEHAHLKRAYLVLLSELSVLINRDCDQVFLLFNDGIFICDYHKGLPELCLDIKNTHKGQTWQYVARCITTPQPMILVVIFLVFLFYIEWKMKCVAFRNKSGQHIFSKFVTKGSVSNLVEITT